MVVSAKGFEMDMSCSLKSLKGVSMGDDIEDYCTVGVFKGDTRSLDYSLYCLKAVVCR